MKNGNFNHYKELSGIMDKNNRLVVTGGSHRMNAAIRYGAETGNYTYVQRLIDAMGITNGDAKAYGYIIKSIIR